MPPHGVCWKTHCMRLLIPFLWLEKCYHNIAQPRDQAPGDQANLQSYQAAEQSRGVRRNVFCRWPLLGQHQVTTHFSLPFPFALAWVSHCHFFRLFSTLLNICFVNSDRHTRLYLSAEVTILEAQLRSENF